ncbi:hypothetical protein CTA2_6695 [Colletotrichum tanaceti]|nr:hypothetical protein CTA2_6695 [Colletotrichum tanaceti]
MLHISHPRSSRRHPSPNMRRFPSPRRTTSHRTTRPTSNTRPRRSRSSKDTSNLLRSHTISSRTTHSHTIHNNSSNSSNRLTIPCRRRCLRQTRLLQRLKRKAPRATFQPSQLRSSSSTRLMIRKSGMHRTRQLRPPGPHICHRLLQRSPPILPAGLLQARLLQVSRSRAMGLARELRWCGLGLSRYLGRGRGRWFLWIFLHWLRRKKRF